MAKTISLGRAVLVLATDEAGLTAGLDRVQKYTKDLTKGLTAAGKEAGNSGELISGMGKAGRDEMKRLAAEVDKPTLSFRQMATVAAGIGAVVAGVAAGVAKLGERGADVVDVRDSFTALTGAMGESANVMLGKLRTATLGNISNFDLMATANKGFSQGLKLTSDQMGTAGDIAAVLADRTGGDLKTAFDTLIQAMATGQDKTLKTIGLNIDAAKATDDYAASIRKKSSELTEEEKKEAIKNAILTEGQHVLALSGKAQVDFADKVAQSKTTISNFVDGVSEWVATSPAVGSWAAVITGASSTVTALGLAFGPVSAGISKLIPLVGLSGLSGAFTSLKVAVTGVNISLVGVAATIATVTVALAAVATAATIAWQAWKLYSENSERAAADSRQAAVDQINLERISKATGRTFKDLAEAVAFVQQSHKELKPVVATTTDFTEKLAAASAALDDELGKLSKTERDQLTKEMKKGALTMEELHTLTGLSSDALALFKQRLADATDKQKAATEADKKATEAKKQFTAAMREFDSQLAFGNAEFARYGKVADGVGAITDRQAFFTGNLTLKTWAFRDSLVGTMGTMAGMPTVFQQVIDNGIAPLADRITGHLTQALQGIPQLFINAFTGGGGVIGALKGIGVSLLNAITQELLQPIWDAVAKWAVSIAAKIAGAFAGGGGGGWAGALASLAGAGGGGAVAGGVGAISSETAFGVAGGGGMGASAALAAVPIAGALAMALPLMISGFINNSKYSIDNVKGGNGLSMIDNVFAMNAMSPEEFQAQFERNNPALAAALAAESFGHGGESHMPMFAQGSGGMRDFGRGTLAMLHGREEVRTEGQARADGRIEDAINGLRRDLLTVIPTVVQNAGRFGVQTAGRRR
jgi:hypothetical protein